MKLSRIYSNNEKLFTPIELNEGFNVVVGEIRLEENKNQDSHNLGKSKLADLIDFGLLKRKSGAHFLFKHYNLFEYFVFYFELKLNDGGYVTIKRSVKENTKISFIKHDVKFQDYSCLPEDNWPYSRITFDKAKIFLDSLLNLTALGNWEYRTAVGYSLRKQEDFVDIFRLSKFRGSHLNWKPYLGHLLGFDAHNLIQNYELRHKLDNLKEEIKNLETEIGVKGQDDELVNDALTLKKQQEKDLQAQLDSFNFNEIDARLVEEISCELDEELEELNKTRYYIKSNIRSLNKSMSATPSNFDLKSTERLFNQAGIMFGDQVTKSYSELVEFNKKITVERAKYVEAQIKELEGELALVSSSIEKLQKLKSEKSSQLNNSNLFEKFKELSKDLILVNVAVKELEKKLEIVNKIKAKNKLHRKISDDKKDIVDLIEVNKEKVTTSEGNVYKRIKDHFSSFVKIVINKDGTLSTTQNQEGNLEFNAGFLSKNSLVFTSESEGHSYKKILCMGFDLSVCLAYRNLNYIRFLYHDGGLETLDTRKKNEFLKHLRTICEQFGIQYILTVIDSDIPSDFSFDKSEQILTLHDEGKSGLLFKIPAW